jgi:hypothetical protein
LRRVSESEKIWSKTGIETPVLEVAESSPVINRDANLRTVLSLEYVLKNIGRIGREGGEERGRVHGDEIGLFLLEVFL